MALMHSPSRGGGDSNTQNIPPTVEPSTIPFVPASGNEQQFQIDAASTIKFPPFWQKNLYIFLVNFFNRRQKILIVTF